MLSMMLIAATPAKKMMSAVVSPLAIFPERKRTYPTTKLKRDQSTLTVGEERPLPGGLAKGLGKASPQTPLTKWGTALARKRPAKKQAM
jgi:hypothetical protein